MVDETYVSGEEHQLSHTSSRRPGRRTTTITLSQVSIVAGIIVLCILSFWGGMAYQKRHTKTLAANASGQSGSFAGGGFGRRQGGGLGQVTAVSATSITVKDQRSGTSMTYSITGSTTITDNGQAAQASDIKTGDTVIVMAASSGSTTASRILVNPDFGNGPAGGGSQQAQ